MPEATLAIKTTTYINAPAMGVSIKGRVMPYYQVILTGENFHLRRDEREELMGFATTRWVKALSEDEAELKAVALVKEDEFLASSKAKNGDIQPMIYLDCIMAVSWFQYWRRSPGKGFTFFIQENGEC